MALNKIPKDSKQSTDRSKKSFAHLVVTPGREKTPKADSKREYNFMTNKEKYYLTSDSEYLSEDEQLLDFRLIEDIDSSLKNEFEQEIKFNVDYVIS